MKPNALVVLVLLLLAGVAAWFGLRGGGDPVPGAPIAAKPEIGQPSPAAAVEKGTAKDPGADADTPRVDRTAVATDERRAPTAAAPTIRGRIVDSHGAPRAGVEIALTSWRMEGDTQAEVLPPIPPAAGSPSRRPKVVTGADGRFETTLPKDHQGYFDLIDDALTFAFGPPPVDGRKGDQDLGDLVAVRGAMLKGIVQDEHGRAVPRVKVSAAQGLFAFGDGNSTMTDDEGAFAIGKLRGGAWMLRTASDKFQPTVQDVTLTNEEQRTDLVLVLRVGNAISGQVVDDLGRPVAGCKVGCKRREARGGVDIERFADDEATTTDAGGFFTLAGITEAKATVRAFGSKYTTAVARDVAAGTGDLLLRVDRTADVHGTLVAADGSPIEGSSVWPVAGAAGATGIGLHDFESMDFGGRQSVRTAADGTFHLKNVKPGPTTILAEGKGHLRTKSSVQVSAGQVLDGVRLVADAGGTARVTVLDAAGKVVAGARVRIEPRQEDPASGIAVGARRVEARMDRTAEGDAGEARVIGDHEALGSATTDEHGVAIVPGLPEGNHVVRASHADHASAALTPIAVPRAGVVESTVRMRAAGFAEVHVASPDGSAAANCTVAMRAEDEPGPDHEAATDDVGVARTGPLAPGKYVAFLRKADGESGAAGMVIRLAGEEDGMAGTKVAFDVVAGKTTRVDMVRPVMARIRGRVTGVDGPVAGCEVSLSRVGDEFAGLPGFDARSTTTGADGAFVLTDVEAGKYTLRYGKPSQLVKAKVEVDVPANTLEIVQDLVLRTGKVTALVVAKDGGDPISGASVELLPAAARPEGGRVETRRVMMITLDSDRGGSATSLTMGAPKARTGADGRVEIDDVPVGTYTLRVEHDDCAPFDRADQVVIESRVTDAGRLELDRSGKIRGKVLTANGDRPSMALVQCRSADTTEWEQPVVAENGEFELKGRKVGRHVLRALSLGQPGPNARGPEVEVEVTAGKPVTTELRLAK